MHFLEFKVLQIWYKTWQSQVFHCQCRCTEKLYYCRELGDDSFQFPWENRPVLVDTYCHGLDYRHICWSYLCLGWHNGLFRSVRKVSILCNMVWVLDWARLAWNFMYQSVTLHIEITCCLTYCKVWCILVWQLLEFQKPLRPPFMGSKLWCTVHYPVCFANIRPLKMYL